MNQLAFTVYCKAAPQGSSRAFIIGGKARITAANTKTKPYRQEVAGTACVAMRNLPDFVGVWAEKHRPVSLVLDFYFAKPASVPKKRAEMVVKPDLDKLVRATKDAMTGIVYHDDGQVVEVLARKQYGVPERVEISVTKR